MQCSDAKQKQAMELGLVLVAVMSLVSHLVVRDGARVMLLPRLPGDWIFCLVRECA